MSRTLIYHGSYTKVDEPKIIIGKNTKDFGRAFYCTSIKEQAQRWARRYKTPVVNVYYFLPDDKLDIKIFSGMNDEWLDFIINCRYGNTHEHDIVIGPMADDRIYNYISDYMDGVITREQFWVMARFNFPTHQIAFCTEKSLFCLRYGYFEEEKKDGWQRG